MKDRNGKQGIDLELVLDDLGQFGRYQMHVYGYLSLIIIFSAIYNCHYVFTAGAVNYRCEVPECESSPTNFMTGGWGKFALPSSESSCSRLVPIGTTCSPASFSNHTKHCTSWVYENFHTIVPEFQLACQEWKRTLVGTMHSAGTFVAVPVTASISDMFGRRLALILTSVSPAIVGVGRAFCNNYYLFLVLEFFESFVGSAVYGTAFILAVEMVGINKRVIGGNILACIYAVGHMLAGAVAWVFPYWRTYTLVIFAPSFGFIFYWFFVEESVRWLLSKGRNEEAVRIILKVSAINRKTLSPKLLQTLMDRPEAAGQSNKTDLTQQGTSVEAGSKEPSLCVQVLTSNSILFRLIVCSFWWVTVTMIYYGLSINSVTLAGNMYVNFILTSLVEIPGCLLSIAILDRFGRKGSIITGFFVCGVSLLVLPFIENATVQISLTLVGKMTISMIFCSIYIYTIELFPTNLRQTLVGICSMTGRVSSMAAPQTPLLMRYMQSLPYLLFGAMAGVAGLLMLLTPETLRMRLPDTIKQAEQLDIAAHTRKHTDIV